MKLKKIALFLALLNLSLFAQNQTLIVGTKITEPFVIQNNSGEMSGLSFELWNIIAKKLNIKYEVRTYDLEGLTNAVAKNQIDIAVSPLTITAEREKLFDFTHSYFTTGLSIAVPNKSDNSLFNIARNVFSFQFFEVVLIFTLVLFIVGLLVWLFERKKNNAEFGDGVSKGLGSSFWWAAVTMTTVGYGDKSPKTVGGRIIALIWMFAGLIMISGFTAAIASALTVDKLDVGINSLADLNNVRVGTVKSSSSEEYLSQNGIDFITTKNIEEGFELIEKKQIDAFVYDAPILKYFVKSKNISNKFRILPIILDPINYAFALPTNSNLRESINRVLLREIDKKEWKIVINNYLGAQ
jgi:ABC-type amino acid transport substrate-binding protein